VSLLLFCQAKKGWQRDNLSGLRIWPQAQHLIANSVRRSFLHNSQIDEKKDHGPKRHSYSGFGFRFVVFHLGIPAAHAGHQYLTKKKLPCSGGTEENRRPG
jgi:hypothetical protein